MTAFRLPDSTTIGAVRLQVSDLDRSVDYYERILGMRAMRREPESADLAAHGDDTVLIELREQRLAAGVPRRGRLGLYHFAILLTDRPALGRLIAHLAGSGVPAGMSDHLVSEAIYLSDPDGLGIEVYTDRPRDTWRRNGGQIVMATNPLDTVALTEAASGVPWDGMPAGTRIGHIHLHVGDIDEAAAFYSSALGFEKTVWSYPGALFMSAGGYHHHLGVNTWAAGAVPAEETDARLMRWELVVPTTRDGIAVAESLAAAGNRVVSENGAWRATDPWGTNLLIVAADA